MGVRVHREGSDALTPTSLIITERSPESFADWQGLNERQPVDQVSRFEDLVIRKWVENWIFSQSDGVFRMIPDRKTSFFRMAKSTRPPASIPLASPYIRQKSEKTQPCRAFLFAGQ